MAIRSEFFEETIEKQTIILQTNAEQQSKIYEELTKNYKKELSSRETALAESQSRIRKAEQDLAKAKNIEDEAERAKKIAEINKDLEVLKAAKKKEQNAISALERKMRDEQKKAIDIAKTYEKNKYNELNAYERAQYTKKVAEDLKKHKEYLQQEADLKIAAVQQLEQEIAARGDKGPTKSQAKKLKQLQSEAESANSDVSEVNDALSAISEKLTELMTASELASAAAAKYADQEKVVAAQRAEVAAAEKAYEAARKKARKNNDAESKKQAKAAKEELDAKKAALNQSEEMAEALLDEAKSAEKASKSYKNMTEEEKKKLALGNATAAASMLTDMVSGNLDALYGEQGRMMGRLQGTDMKWRDSVLNLTTAIGPSGLVSQKGVVAKMVQLVDSGVAYNLEMRAFLAETSENIASTFNAFDSNLLRLIRIQQSDTTAARLGMESALTKLLNSSFMDTSYLAGNVSDTVAGAILDASATMEKNASLEFEYAVQKWMGALYSLGLSDQTVSTIAQGINYLGTGNVSALSGNSQLTTLFAMSAARSGTSYADLLTGGLTAEKTNNLLKSMVEYLAEIAESQTNMVTKSEYADLLGMSSITDLSVFSSLTSTEIENLYKSSVNYETLMTETQNQLQSIKSRLSIAQMIDTVIDNAGVSGASVIGSNAVTYGLWKALSTVKDTIGKFEIPGITAAGFGVASGMDILNLIQGGFAGLGMMAGMAAAVPSMFNGGATNIENWDYNEYTTRGSTMSMLNISDSSRTTTQVETLGTGSSSSSDMQSATTDSGMEMGYSAAGTTSEEQEEGKEVPQRILDAIGESEDIDIITALTDTYSLLDSVITGNQKVNIRGGLSSKDLEKYIGPKRVFYTAIAGVMSSDAVARVTNLSAQLEVDKNNVSGAVKSNNNVTGAAENAAGINTSTSVHDNLLNSTNTLTGSSDVVGSEVFSLESTIASAIHLALTSYFSSGVPVTIQGQGMGSI